MEYGVCDEYGYGRNDVKQVFCAPKIGFKKFGDPCQLFYHMIGCFKDVFDMIPYFSIGLLENSLGEARYSSDPCDVVCIDGPCRPDALLCRKYLSFK